MSDTMDNTRKVTIVASIGLIAIVCLHALLSAGASRVIPRIERHFGIDDSPNISAPVGGINFDQLPRRGMTGASPMLLPNSAARDEIKQQTCTPCSPSPALLAQSRFISTPTPQAKSSIALFVGNDAQSQQLLNAWNTDPQLQSLRQKVSFHTYTASNPLYLTRYANVIAPHQFPGLIFSSPDGGHIHAVNGDWLPTHGPTLYSDLKKAYELKQQVVQQRQLVSSIAPTNTGGNDCDGGSCPPREPLLNPDRDRVLPLFDRDNNQSMEGLLRAILNPGETLGVIVLSVVAALLALAVFQKIRSQS